MSILQYSQSMAQSALEAVRASRVVRFVVVAALFLALTLAALGMASPATVLLPTVVQQSHLVTVASRIVPADPCGGVLAGC